MPYDDILWQRNNMQEYWVNVYPNKNMYRSYYIHCTAIEAEALKATSEILYRIHVKMKEKKPIIEKPITNADLWIKHSNILEKWLD